MAKYAQIRISDSRVINTISLTDEAKANFSNPELSLVLITEEQNKTLNAARYHDGSTEPHFLWTGTEFVVAPDPRPVVTFTPTEIKAEVGDNIAVEVKHSAAGTGLLELVFDGVPIRVNFLAGKATVTINTDRPDRFAIGSEDNFQVAAVLKITVFARKIGRGV